MKIRDENIYRDVYGDILEVPYFLKQSNVAKIAKEELYQKKPEEITMLLYQALEENLLAARNAVESKDYTKVNEKCKRANDIVERLGGGINYEAGIIADQLHVLYEYLVEKIMEAAIHKDVAVFDETLLITRRLSDSWKQAMDMVHSGAAVKKKKVGYDDQADFTTGHDMNNLDVKH